jgi:hypothetical protein
MLKNTKQQVVKIAIGAAILWGGLAGNVFAAESVNGMELNGRYLNGISTNGIRLTNGVSTNGIRLTNGVATNGIRLTNGSGISGRQDAADAPALRPSRLCSIDPAFCDAREPRAEPSNVNVLFVTLPDGKTHVLE